MFTLDEALSAIKDKPEFTVRDRDFGTVIDYNVAFAESFTGDDERSTMILQNLRGTCFNRDGKIISLPYHKFHNLGENAEYHESKFDFSQPHTIQEKLDGSMIRPIPINGSWEFGTRAGVTDVAMKAWHLYYAWRTTDYVKYVAYNTLIEDCLDMDLTPMFEFCSREQRIVIDYPEPRLVLTGIRSNSTGGYLSEGIMLQLARDHVDVVKTVLTTQSSIAEFAAGVKELLGEEGVVVKFDDGRFVKIKAADYCLKHRALDGLRFEKDVLKLILSGGIDDVLPLVTPEVKERIEGYRESVHERLEFATRWMLKQFDKYKNLGSKKEFAEAVKDFPLRNGMFKMWDGKEYQLSDFVLTKCGSQTDVDSIRWLIGRTYYSF